jgi:iron complex outermembrane receptor protein
VFRYALSAYYYDYRNLQLNTTADIGLGVPTLLVQNAGKARVYGLEFEGTLRPSPRHELSLFGSFLDAKYVTYKPLGPTGPDYGGRDLDRTPGFSATGSYTYTLPLDSGASIAFNVRSKVSEHFFLGSASTVQQLREPSYTRSDASITFNAPEDRWYLQAYVHNIEDDVQMSAVTNIGGFLAVAPTDPRTYGVRAGVRF